MRPGPESGDLHRGAHPRGSVASLRPSRRCDLRAPSRDLCREKRSAAGLRLRDTITRTGISGNSGANQLPAPPLATWSPSAAERTREVQPPAHASLLASPHDHGGGWDTRRTFRPRPHRKRVSPATLTLRGPKAFLAAQAFRTKYLQRSRVLTRGQLRNAYPLIRWQRDGCNRPGRCPSRARDEHPRVHRCWGLHRVRHS